MKRLIMCEGSNELAVIEILLKNDAFVFNEDELLGLTPYHARQIAANAQVRTELDMYQGSDVLVMRVGDTQNDKLKIPKEYCGKIKRVEKYCTKPELEILLIISAGLVAEFEKTKSKLRPKEFAKANIRIGNKGYNNSSQFYKDYYENDCDKLKSAILEYYRLKKGAHEKDELYLADLLK